MENCSSYEQGSCSTDIEYIIYIYFFTPIAMSGIIMNMLNLVVFCRRTGKMSQATLTYLTALATYDLCSLSTACFCGVSRCVPAKKEWQVYAKSYYEVYGYLAVSNTFASSSVYLTVVISVERFIYIKFISAKKYACSYWTPLVYILVCMKIYNTFLCEGYILSMEI